MGIPLSMLGVWLHASSEPGLYGGQPVSMSTFGHGFFLIMGGALGLVFWLIIGAIYLDAGNRSSVSNSWQTWAVAVLAGFLVCIIALLAYFVLMMTIFFSLPDDLYRMIFDVPER